MALRTAEKGLHRERRSLLLISQSRNSSRGNPASLDFGSRQPCALTVTRTRRFCHYSSLWTACKQICSATDVQKKVFSRKTDFSCVGCARGTPRPNQSGRTTAGGPAWRLHSLRRPVLSSRVRVLDAGTRAACHTSTSVPIRLNESSRIRQSTSFAARPSTCLGHQGRRAGDPHGGTCRISGF